MSNTRKQYHQGYYEQHKAKYNARSKAWYREHKEQMLEYGRNWKAKNKEKVRKDRRSHYLRNKKKHAAYMREYNAKHVEERTRYSLAKHKQRMEHLKQLLGGKCVGCGTTDKLSFHHINPAEKEFSIASSTHYKLPRLEAEVKKCLLLCQSCHDAAHNAEKRRDNAFRMLKDVLGVVMVENAGRYSIKDQVAPTNVNWCVYRRSKRKDKNA